MTTCHSLSHRLLSLSVAFAWLFGPCKAGGGLMLMTALWDGQHDVAMGASRDGFDLILKHRRGGASPCECPPGHRHTGLIAFLAPAPDGTGVPHPDHLISFHGSLPELAGDQKAVAAAEDSAVAEQAHAPVVTVIKAPETRAATVQSAIALLPFQAQAPPGTTALLI